jgi:DNA-binding transcriptional ArsR family regulator
MKENIEQCKDSVIHKARVDAVKEKMLSDDKIYDLAEIFKIFADTTRIKILYSLFEGEICVCDIATFVGTTQPAISHQLKLLKQAKIVKGRKEGQSVYYSLDDEHIKNILNVGLEHIEEGKVL